jgi:hypothetical protein
MTTVTIAPSADFIPPDDWTEVSGHFRFYQTVTLDANGLGTIYFQPQSANQRWVMKNVIVSTNQPSAATVVPYATLAINTDQLATMSQGNAKGTSWGANNDQFTGAMDVGGADYLTVLFYPPPGASAGQIAMLSGITATAIALGTRYTRTG